MARKSRLKATKPKKPWRRKPSEYRRIYGSRARVEAIKLLACHACQKEPAESAHTENGGMGRKAGWETVVDIGRNCHRRLHALGSVELFDAEAGTDLKARAKWLSEYLHPDRLRRWGVRPRLLDLFCCAGGAATGYARAGFDVTGVDIRPQPRFPFAFVEGDAVAFALEHGASFDVIHASPPCQAHTAMSERWRGKGGLADERPDLIPSTREALKASGRPYIIENVPGAVRSLVNPIRLTGEMFGLAVHRPRIFECEPFIMAPAAVGRQLRPVAVYGKNDGRELWTRKDGSQLRAPKGAAGTLEAGEAMGIDWMEWDELREAIPPHYTDYLGRQMIERLASHEPSVQPPR